MRIKVSEVDYLYKGQLTTKEYEEVKNNDYYIVDYELNDCIECGSTIEYVYNGYIDEVEAWVDFYLYQTL